MVNLVDPKKVYLIIHKQNNLALGTMHEDTDLSKVPL
jgi:hypothetical protein